MEGLRLECISNMSESWDFGIIINNDGFDYLIDGHFMFDYHEFSWKVVNPFRRPGVIRLQTRAGESMTHFEQGIYTCNIPDSNGRRFVFNVGLYPNGFSGKLFKHPVSLYSSSTEPPNITDLTYEEEGHTLTCVSTGSPATTVSWMRDGVSIDDYNLTQTVTDRYSSTYSNVLTVSEGAPGGVTGTYSCTVSNLLGNSTREVVAVG